jgi:hypothetical protein
MNRKDLPVYVYGVIRSGDHSTELRRRGVADRPVDVIESAGLAAIISEIPSEDLRVGRNDLFAHWNVLQELIESTDVLPIRFGTVFPKQEDVRSELLEANGDRLSRLLEDISDRVELQVKVDYLQEIIVPEIVASDPSVKRLQSAPGYASQVELGRRFAAALEYRRHQDAKKIVDRLRPMAEAVNVGESTREYGLLEAAFLVRRRNQATFDEEVERLRTELADRVTFRCIGPLPPYSFVDAAQAVS